VAALAAATVLGGFPGPAAGGTATIPEGAAVWFACTQSVFLGPLSLRCPDSYNPLYTQTFLDNFQRLTPENEFEMLYLEPQAGRFNFSVADQIARFAQEHGKTIRGHALIWNQEMPLWLYRPLLPWSRADLTAVMRAYITTVVSHFAHAYPGVVSEWDVVNEPLGATGQLAPGPWEHGIGPSYIAEALEDAHAAAPTAKLVINQDGADVPGAKANALLSLATQLKQSGAPLDAIGFESHVTPDTAPTLDDLVSLWRRYARVGLDIEVTELDVGNDPGGDTQVAKDAVFERYAEACRLAGNCTGFTVWGVADPYSWLGPATDALLFNSAFQPTPATAIVHSILAGAAARQAPRR
jgi:endo-1,4-beta-xylanase